MVDSKSEVTTTTASTEVTNLYEIATQNCIRILDELTKAQQQYTQSVSNLRHDYVVAAKHTIQNMVSIQEMIASSVNFPIVTPQYAAGSLFPTCTEHKHNRPRVSDTK